MNAFIYESGIYLLQSVWGMWMLFWSFIIAVFFFLRPFRPHFYFRKTKKGNRSFRKKIFFLNFKNLWFQKNHKRKIIQQLPLFVQALSGALQAGYSFHQALIFIETQLPRPLRDFVQKINRDAQLQIPLEEALHDFAQKIDHPDVTFLVESLLLQITSGGDMVYLLNRVHILLEENKKLERDRRSFTAQGKLSAIIVTGLWPVSLVFFLLFAPEQARLLLHTFMGNILLGISVVLEVLGFLWISNIIRIRTFLQ